MGNLNHLRSAIKVGMEAKELEDTVDVLASVLYELIDIAETTRERVNENCKD